ncbi:MAG: hypothetical protein IPJ60_18660 [Sphingobacteriaceae bacterium]|nr:hypothetical protein [Sphingobacteriaceae bacterium]
MVSFAIKLGMQLWPTPLQSFYKNSGAKVLQLNGRFHSDEGLGTVTQLKNTTQSSGSLLFRVLMVEKFPKDIDVNENKN